MRNKINGDTDFTFPEAQTIRNVLESKLSLDELFQTDDEWGGERRCGNGFKKIIQLYMKLYGGL